MLGGTGKDESAGRSAPVQFGFDRIEQDRSALVLVDTHQLITGEHRRRVGPNSIEGVRVIKVKDPAVSLGGDLAQERRLAHRAWTLKKNDGIVAHVIESNGQDAALPKSGRPIENLSTLS